MKTTATRHDAASAARAQRVIERGAQMWGGLPVPAPYEHVVEQQQLERRFFSGAMSKVPA